MKRIILALTLMTSACTTTQATNEPMTAQRAAELMKKDEVILVDVREDDEMGTGIAEGAVWLPTSKINTNDQDVTTFLASLDTSKTVVVYCTAGGRARRFVEILRNKGYKAESIGGFDAWTKAGLPIEEQPH